MKFRLDTNVDRRYDFISHTIYTYFSYLRSHIGTCKSNYASDKKFDKNKMTNQKNVNIPEAYQS